MNTGDMKNVLLAVIDTLDAIPLRTDQVQSAAKIHACSMKLAEIASELKEDEPNETENRPGV